MAITFVNWTDTNGSSLVGIEPTDTAPGDILIAVCLADAGTIGKPSGWTYIGSQLNDGSFLALRACYIVRGSSAPSYTFTAAGASNKFVGVGAWRGALGNPDALASGTSTSVVAPSLTTTADDDLLVCMCAESSGAETVPSGMTKRSVGPTAICFAELQLVGHGSTGTKEFGNSSNPIGAFSIALSPTIAPPTPAVANFTNAAVTRASRW
jgi:hypothetical protein